MAIIYPYDPPLTPALKGIRYGPFSVTGMTGEGTIDLAQQVQAHQGERLDFSATLPPMKREQAEAWIAWRLALRGRYGYFTMAVDPSAIAPMGAVSGSPTADSTPSTQNLARARELYVENLPISTASVFKSGDWVSVIINGLPRLHKVLKTVNSDGDGKAMLDIWPALRGDVTDGAAITYSSPKGTFRLASNLAPWDVEEAQIYGLDFAAIERLP